MWRPVALLCCLLSGLAQHVSAGVIPTPQINTADDTCVRSACVFQNWASIGSDNATLLVELSGVGPADVLSLTVSNITCSPPCDPKSSPMLFLALTSSQALAFFQDETLPTLPIVSAAVNGSSPGSGQTEFGLYYFSLFLVLYNPSPHPIAVTWRVTYKVADCFSFALATALSVGGIITILACCFFCQWRRRKQQQAQEAEHRLVHQQQGAPAGTMAASLGQTEVAKEPECGESCQETCFFKDRDCDSITCIDCFAEQNRSSSHRCPRVASIWDMPGCCFEKPRVRCWQYTAQQIYITSIWNPDEYFRVFTRGQRAVIVSTCMAANLLLLTVWANAFLADTTGASRQEFDFGRWLKTYGLSTLFRICIYAVLPAILRLTITYHGASFDWASVAHLPTWKQYAWFALHWLLYIVFVATLLAVGLAVYILTTRYRCSVLVMNVLAPAFVYEILFSLLKFGFIPLNLYYCLLVKFGAEPLPLPAGTAEAAAAASSERGPLLDSPPVVSTQGQSTASDEFVRMP